MLHKLAYDLSLAFCCACAFFWGGRAERWGAGMLAFASVLTIPATWANPEWTAIQDMILAIDTALLAGYVALALLTDRFWPMWVAGFHLVGIATHLTMLTSIGIIPRAYAHVQAFWAYPMMIAMIIGSVAHHRTTRGFSQG
jgi:hypothetical protein